MSTFHPVGTNDVSALSGALEPMTMTTREIAELTGKEHKNVLADARLMLVALGQAVADFSATALAPGPNGSTRATAIIRLPKRETLILVSGYSVKMRAKIIDRWQELELGSQRIPQTLPEALRLAADLADAKSRVDQQLALAGPKADALDRLADAEGLLNPTNAAKALQITPKRLFEFLRERRWTYRRAGGSSDIAYQDKIAAGYLTHKVCVVQRDEGPDRAYAQVLITAKGLTKLAAALAIDAIADSNAIGIARPVLPTTRAPAEHVSRTRAAHSDASVCRHATAR